MTQKKLSKRTVIQPTDWGTWNPVGKLKLIRDTTDIHTGPASHGAGQAWLDNPALSPAPSVFREQAP